MKPEYWNAFGARLAAFGLGNALRGFSITGNEEPLKRLNEFLRAEMPALADDAVAAKWYKDNTPDFQNQLRLANLFRESSAQFTRKESDGK